MGEWGFETDPSSFHDSRACLLSCNGLVMTPCLDPNSLLEAALRAVFVREDWNMFADGFRGGGGVTVVQWLLRETGMRKLSCLRVCAPSLSFFLSIVFSIFSFRFFYRSNFYR